ncbi:MAG: hypothetical protein ACLFNU_05460 [Bacteroidales bacterium]
MIQKLKDYVEHEFGKKISYQKDCKTLSNSILNKSSEVISPSTLRRFFGFLSTNSKPSRVTLDILSRYCGFTCWDDFIESNKDSESSTESYMQIWGRAQQNAIELSDRNCNLIKNNNQLNSDDITKRHFAHQRLNYLINSDYTATPFVGPGGYGKSSLLVEWYESNANISKGKNNIVLFLSARNLEAWFGTEKYFDYWLLSLIELKTTELFDRLKDDSCKNPGKFILIIDALDEISLPQSKTERLYQAIHNLVNSMPSKWFKLVISSRLSVWKKFTKVEDSLDNWYFAGNQNFTSEGANMPPLNENEVQLIFNRTINKITEDDIMVEELPYDFFQTISYPYYLKIYIELYKKDSSQRVTDRIDLLTEFLKKEVYQNSYADESTDILNYIVDKSKLNRTFGTVKKNDIKEKYPIHLKLAGNYFNAYNHLLSFGILAEELVENEFGAFTKMVSINQVKVYGLLTIQKLIEKEGDISFKVFEVIQKEYANSSILPLLINLLFEVAYKKRKVEALIPIFTLSDEALATVFEQSSIHQTLSKDDYMRGELIPYYAKSKKARKYLFEKNINLNSIVTSSNFLTYNYLQHAKSMTEIFFGKTLLYISNAYNLDFNWIDEFINEMPETPPEKMPPLVCGLWFSCQEISSFFRNANNQTQISKNIDSFLQSSILNSWNEHDMLVFELGLVFSLLITKQHQLIVERLSNLFQLSAETKYTSEKKALKIYYGFAKWRVTSVFDDEIMQELQSLLGEVPSWISYQTNIIAKSWLAMYYLKNGMMNKAHELYRKSVEISNLAGYKIFEAKLLKNLSSVLNSLGEESMAKDCDALFRSLAEDSNVDCELL